MGKKLAVVFPGVGYSVDRPLLYYSRKVLIKYGYEVVNVSYPGLEKESIFEAGGSNRISKDKLLDFVTKAEGIVNQQLAKVDFSNWEKIVFISKSVGAVVATVYAKKLGIDPYHFMITPLEYSFNFMDEEKGSIFCGREDPLVDYQRLKEICAKKQLALYDFKLANHSLETEDIAINLDYLKQYVSILDDVVADMEKSIYDFEMICRDKQIKQMTEYKGKVLLIVNSATGCGFTPQYQILEQIYRKYHKQGFEILDFPCNQFDNQAAGSDEEIHSFCTSRYDISFEQFAKVHVNGEKQIGLYRYLKSRKAFRGFDKSKPDGLFLIHKLEATCPGYERTRDIKWNFTKFLVNREGQVIERFEPDVSMEVIEAAIQQIL